MDLGGPEVGLGWDGLGVCRQARCSLSCDEQHPLVWGQVKSIPALSCLLSIATSKSGELHTLQPTPQITLSAPENPNNVTRARLNQVRKKSEVKFPRIEVPKGHFAGRPHSPVAGLRCPADEPTPTRRRAATGSGGWRNGELPLTPCEAADEPHATDERCWRQGGS